jgi:hypothetical protein
MVYAFAEISFPFSADASGLSFIPFLGCIAHDGVGYQTHSDFLLCPITSNSQSRGILNISEERHWILPTDQDAIFMDIHSLFTNKQ